MSYRNDLTRWNRSGLDRFRYVDHNAANYLETIRLQLKEKFTTIWPGSPGPSPAFAWEQINKPIPAGESLEKRIERLEIQYKGSTQDIAWETIRSFARATHIITEYLNAYANEGYLETATQWDNIRKLVEILDYRPAPPASASTYIGLYAKEGITGEVDKGLQVKHVPEDGSKPVIFETLAPIEISDELNEFQLKQWNFSVDSALENSSSNSYLFTAHDEYELNEDEFCILVDTKDNNSKTIKIKAPYFNHAGKTKIKFKRPDDENLTIADWQAGSTEIWASPDFIAQPALNGGKVVQFKKPHGLDVNRVIAWDAAGWRSNTIREIDELRIRLKTSTLPGAGKNIYEAFKVEKRTGASGVEVPLSKDRKALFDSTGALVSETALNDVLEGGIVTHKILPGENHAYLVNNSNPVIGKIVQKETEYRFEGDAGELKTDDYVIAHYNGDEKHQSTRITTVEQFEDYFYLGFADTQTSGLVRLSGNFTQKIKAKDYNYNSTALTNQGLRLHLEENQTPSALLNKGRELVLSQKNNDEFIAAMRVKVIRVTEDGGDTVLLIDPVPVIEDGYTHGNTIISANVVEVGHGEMQPEKTLGSGDASKVNQEYLLKETELSFIADSTFPVGVKADINVYVGNQRWNQVPNLLDSEEADPHYMTLMTEDNQLRILFGDGKHGRRLVTGINNVRAAYRKGNGLRGNEIVNGLIKIVKPHALVEKVIQPIKTSNGGERENTTSLRDHASSTILTLQRAVSLSDFTYLATNLSSVWQALAIKGNYATSGGRIAINVIIMAAGGGAMSTELKEDIEKTLTNYAIPGVLVKAENSLPTPINLEVNIYVKREQYKLEDVQLRVEEALYNAFTLQIRKIGEPVYLSEIYQVVENIEGVEYSVCELDGDASKQQLAVDNIRKVFYLPKTTTSFVTARDYEL